MDVRAMARGLGFYSWARGVVRTASGAAAFGETVTL